MRPYRRRAILMQLALIIFLTFAFNNVMATEEPEYQVLERNGDFELRQYKPYIVAETLVEGDFQDVGNEGFRRLFDYISGKNLKKQSIPMTAPVTQEAPRKRFP